MSRRLTVLMPFHTPFYTPLAAGVALGHFREEGLDVAAVPAPVFGKPTMDALLGGDVEISLGGLMRSFELADRTGQIVVHFAEVCSRNGFFLVAREPRPDFRWTDLVGRTVLSFAEAPRLAVHAERAAPSRGRSGPGEDRAAPPGPEAVAAFRRGQAISWSSRSRRSSGWWWRAPRTIVASMGEATGPLPFSSYMTTPAFLSREPDVHRAVHARGVSHPALARRARAADVARAVAPAFPETEAPLLERAVGRYLGQGTWARDPLLRREGFRLPRAHPARRRSHPARAALRGAGRHRDRAVRDGGGAVKFGVGFFPDGGPDRISARQYYDEALALAERADALGYDSLKMVEHHFTSYGGYSPDPAVFLAACAQRTRRIRLVTGAVLPAFNHPLKLAGQLAMLDALSGGRLDVGGGARVHALRVRRLRRLDGGEPAAVRGGHRGAPAALDRGARDLRGPLPPLPRRHGAAPADPAAAPADLGGRGGEPGVVRLGRRAGLPHDGRARTSASTTSWPRRSSSTAAPYREHGTRPRGGRVR
jgi:ABC-type nitrate/sulfonate/bicarbonate transport system substrate-binding protein